MVNKAGNKLIITDILIINDEVVYHSYTIPVSKVKRIKKVKGVKGVKRGRIA